MSATTNEMEMLRKAIRLLYSPHPNSAAELRLMLDEAIKQRYGAELMISNNMSKRLRDEEANFPGRATTPPPQTIEQDASIDEVINLTGSPAKTISDSPDTIIDSDEGIGGAVGGAILAGGDDDVNLKEFGDLNCAVCGEIVFTATNRLIECSNCGTLYHQECHKPPITDEETSEGQEHNWQCDNCLNKPSTSKAAGIVVIEEPISLVSKTKSSATSSRSSSSSNSSSSFAVVQQEITNSFGSTSSVQSTLTSSNKHHHHKSSRSHKEDRPSSSSSKSGSSNSAINPTFTVVSASEKSSSHSSKKSSHSSSSSKSSSSKSSSKHHDSSKRKSKQV